MKQGLKDNFVKLAEELKLNEREGRNLPIMKGQTLTFVEGADLFGKVDTTIGGTDVHYGVFHTEEGFDVPFSQIARNNNGLKLKRGKQSEMLTEFVDRIDGKYTVTVADVKKLESSFNDNKQTYLIFQIAE